MRTASSIAEKRKLEIDLRKRQDDALRAEITSALHALLEEVETALDIIENQPDYILQWQPVNSIDEAVKIVHRKWSNGMAFSLKDITKKATADLTATVAVTASGATRIERH